jgi:hypothetical protein
LNINPGFKMCLSNSIQLAPLQRVYWQQDEVLWSELINNLAYAGTGVFIVVGLCTLNQVDP